MWPVAVPVWGSCVATGTNVATVPVQARQLDEDQVPPRRVCRTWAISRYHHAAVVHSRLPDQGRTLWLLAHSAELVDLGQCGDTMVPDDAQRGRPDEEPVPASSPTKPAPPALRSAAGAEDSLAVQSQNTPSAQSHAGLVSGRVPEHQVGRLLVMAGPVGAGKDMAYLVRQGSGHFGVIGTRGATRRVEQDPHSTAQSGDSVRPRSARNIPDEIHAHAGRIVADVVPKLGYVCCVIEINSSGQVDGRTRVPRSWVLRPYRSGRRSPG